MTETGHTLVAGGGTAGLFLAITMRSNKPAPLRPGLFSA